MIGGKYQYKCNSAIVITNSNFTPNAIKQAKSSGVELINGQKLLELITTYMKREDKPAYSDSNFTLYKQKIKNFVGENCTNEELNTFIDKDSTIKQYIEKIESTTDENVVQNLAKSAIEKIALGEIAKKSINNISKPVNISPNSTSNKPILPNVENINQIRMIVTNQ